MRYAHELEVNAAFQRPVEVFASCVQASQEPHGLDVAGGRLFGTPDYPSVRVVAWTTWIASCQPNCGLMHVYRHCAVSAAKSHLSSE